MLEGLVEVLRQKLVDPGTLYWASTEYVHLPPSAELDA
jgi:hypothetical protein